jgi:PAS domain S-box-containing protein
VKHSTNKRSSKILAKPSLNRSSAERIRAYWASTGLGPISSWSERVRTAVPICADIASVQQKRLVAARHAQGRRVAELSKRNKALPREVAKHKEKEAVEVVRPQLEALIEELRFMRESLQNSENRLQAIADNSPSLIFLKDTQGRYLLVNKGVERTVGTTREQIIGKSDEDLFAPHQGKVFRANDLEVLNTGAALQFEQFVLADSGPRWSIVQKFPIFDAGGTICSIGGIVTDISEGKRAEEQLNIAEERARLIVDTAPDAVITIDSNGTIIGWNEHAERIFGWPRYEVIQQRIADVIFPAAYRDALEAELKHLLETGEGTLLNRRIEITGFHRNGHEFPIELAIASVKVRGNLTFNAFVRDLTEKKHVEEALREAREELARVTRLTAMGQLTASIAHEINQPLTAIVANSDTCLHWLGINQPDLGKARAAAERMARDARHASNIIAHIRSLMNRTVSERAPVDINQLIQNVLDLTCGEMRKRKVSVDIELSKSIPMIFGDRVQLQQVILNLVLNSIEAMTPVRDRPRRLLVKSQLKGANDIQVSLHDTGVGFDPALADRIFGAFFTTKPNGTGMGLSICRSIVEAHGGQVFAMRGTPHGAVFQFKLPIGSMTPHE